MLVREALRTSSVSADLLVAYDGEEALKYLASRSFQLVILDLNLPRANGHTILERRARLDGAPPIVVFSSSRGERDRQQALQLGAREYVVKPSHLDEFVQTIHGMLERWNHGSIAS
jgi:DNA-binding response OmpR family regulator